MSHRTLLVLALFFSLITPLVAQVGVIESISVPPNSQTGYCWVVAHSAPSVSVPPYPFDSALGAGNLINPDPASNVLFSLHDHVYVAPNVPDPTRARVTYTFNTPVTVGGIAVVQHANGIAQLEGFVGNLPNALASTGLFFGTYGNVSGPVIFPELYLDTFVVPNPASGSIFQLIIRRTTEVNGWANYHIVPLDLTGFPIQPATFGLEGCANGTVGMPGPLLSPLTLNGSFGGGASHLVDIAVSTPITVGVGQPSTNPSPAHFIVIGLTAVPDPSDSLLLPGSIGTLCLQSPYSGVAFPGLFVLANSFGPDPLALLPSTPAPWSFSFAGLPFPFQFTLHGVIEESPGVIRVMNAVLGNVY